MSNFEMAIAIISAVNSALVFVLLMRSGRQVAELRQRLAVVEEAAKRAPTHDDLAKIYDRVNETSRLIHRVEGVVDSMNSSLNLLLHRTMRDIPTRT